MVWCGVVWYGVEWSGVVWCGVVWCGVWCASPSLPESGGSAFLLRLSRGERPLCSTSSLAEKGWGAFLLRSWRKDGLHTLLSFKPTTPSARKEVERRGPSLLQWRKRNHSFSEEDEAGAPFPQPYSEREPSLLLRKRERDPSSLL